MDSYMKRFLRELLAHQNNLTEYIDNLYKNRDYGDLNEILGLLKKEGYVACIYADNRAYNISYLSHTKVKNTGIYTGPIPYSEKRNILKLISEGMEEVSNY